MPASTINEQYTPSVSPRAAAPVSTPSQSHSRPNRNLPQVSAKQLLDFFQAKMSNFASGRTKGVVDGDEKKDDHHTPPEKVSLKGFCEDVHDLTPRTRRACLNCGIDFHVEVIAMPSLRNLPAAARGHVEAEAKWLHHLGARRFDIVDALEMERSRMIEQQQQQQQQEQQQLQPQRQKLSLHAQVSKRRAHSHRSGEGRDDDNDNDSDYEYAEDSPRAGGGGGGGGGVVASTTSGRSSPRSRNGTNRSAGMDPSELQAHRAAKREAAMLDAMQKKLAAQERVRQHEERSLALAQLALKRQQEQERAAKLARERAEKINAEKRRERAEQEHQKLMHRREVQHMKDELERALQEQQLNQEAEKDLTVDERRRARTERLKAQRRELEAKRLEQRERLVHLQRSIDEAEELRKLDIEEKLRKADVARDRQRNRKEEILAMHSAYEEERTETYRDRKAKLEEAHAASITRYKEKGHAAVERRDEIMHERQAILKARILQHAQREIQAKKLRIEVEKHEVEDAKLLEERLTVQERRSKRVLQQKLDAAKMRLAEKQMVFHDHKMHANRIHKMHEVREHALAKKLEQKLSRIEQLKEDAQELEQYRKGLRHILDQGGDFLLHPGVDRRAASHHSAGFANHNVVRDQMRLATMMNHSEDQQTSYIGRRALTPMPSSSSTATATTGGTGGGGGGAGLARMEPASAMNPAFGRVNNNNNFHNFNRAPAPLTPEPR